LFGQTPLGPTHLFTAGTQIIRNFNMRGKKAIEFLIHPLVLEDIVHTEQRPKLEEFYDCLFLTLKMMYNHLKDGALRIEQVSLLP